MQAKDLNYYPMKIIFKILSPLLPIMLSFCTKKNSVQGLVTNPNFENKINSYLSYTVPIMTVDELHKIQNEVIIFDARSEEEYETSHLKEALFFDKKGILEKKEYFKNKRIVVYCSIGYRSEKAAKDLVNEGFNQVYNLYGGIFEWANEGYHLEDTNSNPTTNVHTYNKSWSKWVTNKIYNKKW